MAWYQTIRGHSSWDFRNYYTIRDTSGGEVRPISQLISDGPSLDYAPSVTALAGDRVLFAWTRSYDTWDYKHASDIYYAISDSAGNLVIPATNLSSDGASQRNYGPDAAQLQDGRAVIAWTVGVYPNERIRYAVLDAGYQRISGPATLSNPAAPLWESLVSVAPSGQMAVLTWIGQSFERSLYYALINRDGAQVTPPQRFYNVQAGTQLIDTSHGNGNTSLQVTTMQVSPTRIGHLTEIMASSRSTSVLVEADGPDLFSWTASTEASWITLSRTSGPSGEGFTVTTAPGLPLGAYHASIRIVADKGNIENPNQTIVVDLRVVEKVHSDYLPICSR